MIGHVLFDLGVVLAVAFGGYVFVEFFASLAEADEFARAERQRRLADEERRNAKPWGEIVHLDPDLRVSHVRRNKP